MTSTTTAESVVLARLRAGMASQQEAIARVTNGARTYRDPGTRESYTVGYGGERTYTSSPTADTTVQPATEPMKRFIDSLLVEREHVALAEDVIDSIKANKPQAHRFIEFLLKQPRVSVPVVVEPVVVEPKPTRQRLNFSEILDGNYAIRLDGVVKFYRVSTSKDGFKNVQVRASDSLFPVQGKAGIAIMHRIVEAGLAESRMLFAQELGRCWRCGKSLTDEESRARGTGPDCASK